MTQMSMGANMPIPVAAVRASLRWTGGPGIPDVDASALLLAENGEVSSDADFVFYNQPEHASAAVRMAGRTAPPRASDSMDIDLARVPGTCRRIILAASCDGGTFGQVPELEMVLSDGTSGQVLAAFPMRADTETAFVSAEIYRRDDAWRFRAIGQGYSSGLAGMAADFGITVGPPSPPAPPPAAPSQAPASPAPAAPASTAPAAPASAPASSPPSGTAGSLLDLDTPL